MTHVVQQQHTVQKSTRATRTLVRARTILARTTGFVVKGFRLLGGPFLGGRHDTGTLLSGWWSWLCPLPWVHLVAPHDEFSSSNSVHDSHIRAYVGPFLEPFLAFKPDTSMLVVLTKS